MHAGDSRRTAAVVGAQLGLPERFIHSELLPAHKLELVKQYRSKRKVNTHEDEVVELAAAYGQRAAGVGAAAAAVSAAAPAPATAGAMAPKEGVAPAHTVVLIASETDEKTISDDEAPSSRWCCRGKAGYGSVVVAHVGEFHFWYRPSATSLVA